MPGNRGQRPLHRLRIGGEVSRVQRSDDNTRNPSRPWAAKHEPERLLHGVFRISTAPGCTVTAPERFLHQDSDAESFRAFDRRQVPGCCGIARYHHNITALDRRQSPLGSFGRNTKRANFAFLLQLLERSDCAAPFENLQIAAVGMQQHRLDAIRSQSHQAPLNAACDPFRAEIIPRDPFATPPLRVELFPRFRHDDPRFALALQQLPEPLLRRSVRRCGIDEIHPEVACSVEKVRRRSIVRKIKGLRILHSTVASELDGPQTEHGNRDPGCAERSTLHGRNCSRTGASVFDPGAAPVDDGPMQPDASVGVDVVVFGGGVAGLWILDACRRDGLSALVLESHSLGRGQTVWSQGILHGGLKYTLSGVLTRAAQSIRDMPAFWRACLAGERDPDLSPVTIRSPHCHLWRTESVRSRAAMIGARVGLRTHSSVLAREARPAILKACPGTVAQLDEQVIDPVSLMQCFGDRHQGRLLRIDTARGLDLGLDAPGMVREIVVRSPLSDRRLMIAPRCVVLAAGGGNAALRERSGLDASAMQIRPLRMVMLRGATDRLPELNGHCVDGMRTRVTITSASDHAGHRIWQIGGEVAERGATMDDAATIALARRELLSVLPGFSPAGLEWSAYEAPRAEGRTPDGRRPEEPVILVEGNVITTWPSKFVLAPRLAEQTLAAIRTTLIPAGGSPTPEIDWPAPDVAEPPWEEARRWTADHAFC